MAGESLEAVDLSADTSASGPASFRAGQRQRLGIIRAFALSPKLIVADGPVSALDVSIRAQILDLFADLNGRLGIAYLFITHDLTVARAITDDVMVMDEGRDRRNGQDIGGARPSAIGCREGAGCRDTRPAPGDRPAAAGTRVGDRVRANPALPAPDPCSQVQHLKDALEHAHLFRGERRNRPWRCRPCGGQARCGRSRSRSPERERSPARRWSRSRIR